MFLASAFQLPGKINKTNETGEKMERHLREESAVAGDLGNEGTAGKLGINENIGTYLEAGGSALHSFVTQCRLEDGPRNGSSAEGRPIYSGSEQRRK